MIYNIIYIYILHISCQNLREGIESEEEREKRGERERRGERKQERARLCTHVQSEAAGEAGCLI
jgi:hypothetical protein